MDFFYSLPLSIRGLPIWKRGLCFCHPFSHTEPVHQNKLAVKPSCRCAPSTPTALLIHSDGDGGGGSLAATQRQRGGSGGRSATEALVVAAAQRWRLYSHMQNYTYTGCRMHMGNPVCIQAGIAKIFAYGDPRLHNKIVRIRGVTYTPRSMGNSYMEYPPPH